MNTRCVDAAFYWTPEEAGAIVDYLDRLRDTIWELYSDDIIDCRTTELDEQGDRQLRPRYFADDGHQTAEDYAKASISYNPPGNPAPMSGVMNNNITPRTALPSLDDLPSLSDENIGDMLNLLHSLVHACEEHYKDPIRRLNEQRHQELLYPWKRDLSKPPMTDGDDDIF